MSESVGAAARSGTANPRCNTQVLEGAQLSGLRTGLHAKLLQMFFPFLSHCPSAFMPGTVRFALPPPAT